MKDVDAGAHGALGGTERGGQKNSPQGTPVLILRPANVPPCAAKGTLQVVKLWVWRGDITLACPHEGPQEKGAGGERLRDIGVF